MIKDFDREWLKLHKAVSKLIVYSQREVIDK